MTLADNLTVLSCGCETVAPYADPRGEYFSAEPKIAMRNYRSSLAVSFPVVIALSACGGAGVRVQASSAGSSGLQVSARAIQFTDTAVGSNSSPQVIKITNLGSGSATISAIAITGPNSDAFQLSNGCGVTLPANSSCAVSLTYKPAGSGDASAILLIRSNAPTSPAVTLRGNTLNFPPCTATDSRVILDVGIAALNPRNNWTV